MSDDAQSAAASIAIEALTPVGEEEAIIIHPVGDTLSATDNGVTAEIPSDPTDGLALTNADGAQIGIDLPGANAADDARSVDSTTAVYTDALPGTSIAAQALRDGGIRALVVIEAANAPTEYQFPISLPPGYGIALQDDGSVEIYDISGTTQITVPAPWARDARGIDLATSYRLEGATLIQTVDHIGATYPVVADPAFETNCGIVSCKLYFDRAQTRNARDFWWLTGAGASACFFLSGPAAPVCAVAIAAQAGAINAYAGRYYEEGNCVKLKVFVTGGPIIPERHKRGERNCK